MNKENKPCLCSLCRWGYPERDDCVEPENESRKYNLTECIDFQIDENRINMNKEEFDYPAAARAIALWLKPFCNEELPYPEMIADAARKAAKSINEIRQWVIEQRNEAHINCLEEQKQAYNRVIVKIESILREPCVEDFAALYKELAYLEKQRNEQHQKEITALKNDLRDYKEECDRLAGIADFWQKKYYDELRAGYGPVKIDNL